MGWDKVNKDISSGPMGLLKWGLTFIIAIVLIVAGLNFVLKPANMAVDRMVMKNSFQYVEGMEQRAAILQANIDEINIALENDMEDPKIRQDLLKQKRILTVQLKAITVNK